MEFKFTHLSEDELRTVIRDELEAFFITNPLAAKEVSDEIGGIDLAVEIIGLAKSTIYGNIDKIPHSKKSKKLYFIRAELTEWIKGGRRKTQAELASEAQNFSLQKHRRKSILK